MNFLKKVNLFVLLCVLMLAVHAFAQPVEKGEHIDAGISQNLDSADVINPYYPSGFTIETAYAGPTILQLRLFGGRGNLHQLFKNKWISFGYAVGYIDVDFQRGFVSDDCLFVLLISLMGHSEEFESFCGLLI